MSRKALYTISMLYLWLPLAIFLGGWTYWWVAAIPTILGLWVSVWPFRHLTGRIQFASSWIEILILSLIVLWVVSAGVRLYT